MPQIFDKNCKIKIIEYGSSAPQKDLNWDTIKDQIQRLLPKITKRAS